MVVRTWLYATRRASSSPGIDDLGSLASWQDLERPLPPYRTCSHAQASVKRGDEPEDGGHHRRLSNRLGLLRLVDCFAAGGRMERHRGTDQFRERRRVPVFRPQSKAVSTGVRTTPACRRYLFVLPGQGLERVANL